MQHIETVTVGSGGAASITFSAIPDTYTDLYLVVSGRNSVDNYFSLRFNGLTTNLTSKALIGTGSAVSSSSYSFIPIHDGYTSYTASTFGSSSIYIPNYTSAIAKSVSVDSVSENNATATGMRIVAGLWNSTSAITSIQLVSAGSFQQYSSASLYGILAGSDGIVAVS